MTVFEHWETQKDALRADLAGQTELPGVVRAVRHALLQTEQNALAGLEDDALRQQAGVLFSCLKSSAGLLEAPVAGTVWLPQSMKAEKKPRGALTLWLVAAILQVLSGLYAYGKGLWLGWTLALAVLIAGTAALLAGRRTSASAPSQDEARVTLRPDVDRLFSLLDGQLRAMDRYLNDFSYLNEQLRGGGQCADTMTLSRVANLLEALYECEDEARGPAEEAAKQMLESMGLKALDYSEDSRRLFTALPSKTETRTLSPAIVSIEDFRLLRRGTAAVRTEVA